MVSCQQCQVTFLSWADVECGYCWRCYSQSRRKCRCSVDVRPYHRPAFFSNVQPADRRWRPPRFNGARVRLRHGMTKMPSTWHYHNFRWDLAILARFQSMTHADSLSGLFIESLPAEVFSPVCCRNLQWSCVISSENELRKKQMPWTYILVRKKIHILTLVQVIWFRSKQTLVSLFLEFHVSGSSSLFTIQNKL